MPASKGRKIVKRVLIGIVALLVVACVGMFVYMCIPHQATQEARAVMTSQDQTVFTPSDKQESSYYERGLVFYPGAKCEPAAYAPLMQKLADQGWLCILVDAPFHFMLMNEDAASQPIASHPQVDRWYVGGHSLGGMVAARYARSHTDTVEGLVLCGAYSDGDLSQTSLNVISIYGSQDGVLDRSAYAASLQEMPQSFHELVIEGGNHAQFGDYGDQLADNPAAISAEDQQTQTAEFIANAAVS